MVYAVYPYVSGHYVPTIVLVYLLIFDYNRPVQQQLPTWVAPSPLTEVSK